MKLDLPPGMPSQHFTIPLLNLTQSPIETSQNAPIQLIEINYPDVTYTLVHQ